MVPDALNRLAGCLLVLVVPLATAAESEPPRELLQPPKVIQASPITDRFALRGTYFQPAVDMPLRYDPAPGVPGTPITAEDTFGMDDELNQGTVEMLLRVQPRHRLRADFYKMTRTGEAVLDELVVFGDETFLPGDRVLSSMDLRMLGVTYLYSLFQRERWELGIGAGMHLLQLQGEAEVPARQVGEEFDIAGPFASLAIDGTWLITKRFSANARVQYLTGSSDTVDATYANYHLDVQFRFRPNLAFGLGYSSLEIDADSVGTDFPGSFGLTARGPEAFIRVSF